MPLSPRTPYYRPPRVCSNDSGFVYASRRRPTCYCTGQTRENGLVKVKQIYSPSQTRIIVTQSDPGCDRNSEECLVYHASIEPISISMFCKSYTNSYVRALRNR